MRCASRTPVTTKSARAITPKPWPARDTAASVPSCALHPLRASPTTNTKAAPIASDPAIQAGFLDRFASLPTSSVTSGGAENTRTSHIMASQTPKPAQASRDMVEAATMSMRRCGVPSPVVITRGAFQLHDVSAPPSERHPSTNTLSSLSTQLSR